MYCTISNTGQQILVTPFVDFTFQYPFSIISFLCKIFTSRIWYSHESMYEDVCTGNQRHILWPRTYSKPKNVVPTTSHCTQVFIYHKLLCQLLPTAHKFCMSILLQFCYQLTNNSYFLKGLINCCNQYDRRLIKLWYILCKAMVRMEILVTFICFS